MFTTNVNKTHMDDPVAMQSLSQEELMTDLHRYLVQLGDKQRRLLLQQFIGMTEVALGMPYQSGSATSMIEDQSIGLPSTPVNVEKSTVIWDSADRMKSLTSVIHILKSNHNMSQEEAEQAIRDGRVELTEV